ncbi:MAG: isoleucine--tRNA ligase, partial [Betaproteobacteria bacterium]
PVVQQLQTFCSEELGGFYLGVLKDRLYTAARTSPARRSAQTALALIRDEMLKFMAPVLSFTAEEAWRTIHPQDASVFVHTWRKEIPDLGLTPEFVAKWDIIRAYRAELLKKLEEAREAGEIGSSLQAEADIIAPPGQYEALTSLGDDLRFVFITSAARVTQGTERLIHVTRSAQRKCERCWHYRADVGSDAMHAGLCGRCVANLFGPGEPRAFA